MFPSDHSPSGHAGPLKVVFIPTRTTSIDLILTFTAPVHIDWDTPRPVSSVLTIFPGLL
ncbi:hypothetical protein M404DRAFT_36651 [Pisolithus tinctorius Marx 270]|uniref:Uncharacterized protein n=1 Tax=Pisolithus tinctorius Marx 270 TaxID=870435 RepID=A0A0C3J5B3_PISTI|nr:hypothetical protein M404DRAFT_36651 [Pisolithus tinctorius Marx 270]